MIIARLRRAGAASILALFAASCSDQPANGSNASENSQRANQVAPVALPDHQEAANAPVSEASEITLSALTAADVEKAALDGELGCGFSTKAKGEILVAMGYADSKERAQGVVKVGDRVEPVSAADGFDGMVKGPVFAGKGETITIAITGEPTDDSESPPVPATLTYDRADGARRSYAGEWVCGP